MRMRNVAKKVTWLERNKYPPHKPRKYWPPTFYIHDPVAKQDVICMQCRSQPCRNGSNDTPNINKVTWRVFHISEQEVTLRNNKPWPTDSDQCFLCPNCSGTAEADSDLCYPYTVMWIVENKDSYQPHSEPIEGMYINANWTKYLPTSSPTKPHAKKRRKKHYQPHHNHKQNKENKNTSNNNH